MNGLELQRREAAELLASPEYFTCEKAHCRMKKQACADRQARGIVRSTGGRTIVPEPCIGCTQGAEIALEVRAQQGKTKKRPGRTKPMTTATTKTAQTEPTIVCATCEERKPPGEFHRAKKGKYGRASICKVCKSVSAKEYWKRKKGAQGPAGKPESATTIPATQRAVTGPPPPDFPDPGHLIAADRAAATVRLFGRDTLILQFEGHEDLKTWLEKTAKDSFRDPDQQALYILSRASREGAA